MLWALWVKKWEKISNEDIKEFIDWIENDIKKIYWNDYDKEETGILFSWNWKWKIDEDFLSKKIQDLDENEMKRLLIILYHLKDKWKINKWTINQFAMSYLRWKVKSSKILSMKTLYWISESAITNPLILFENSQKDKLKSLDSIFTSNARYWINAKLFWDNYYVLNNAFQLKINQIKNKIQEIEEKWVETSIDRKEKWNLQYTLDEAIKIKEKLNDILQYWSYWKVDKWK